MTNAKREALEVPQQIRICESIKIGFPERSRLYVYGFYRWPMRRQTAGMVTMDRSVVMKTMPEL